MKEVHKLSLGGASHLTHVIEITGEPVAEHEQRIIWIDFRCWSVACWALDYSSPEFAVQGETTVERTVSNHEEATPDFTGYVKWDGCNEWTFESMHGCDGIEGLRKRHSLEETCLRLAHAAMAASGCEPDWEAPAPVVEAERGCVCCGYVAGRDCRHGHLRCEECSHGACMVRTTDGECAMPVNHDGGHKASRAASVPDAGPKSNR